MAGKLRHKEKRIELILDDSSFYLLPDYMRRLGTTYKYDFRTDGKSYKEQFALVLEERGEREALETFSDLAIRFFERRLKNFAQGKLGRFVILRCTLTD